MPCPPTPQKWTTVAWNKQTRQWVQYETENFRYPSPEQLLDAEVSEIFENHLDLLDGQLDRR